MLLKYFSAICPSLRLQVCSPVFSNRFHFAIDFVLKTLPPYVLIQLPTIVASALLVRASQFCVGAQIVPSRSKTQNLVRHFV